MENYSDEMRKRLQDNLLLIRQTAGWTAEQFGEMIGVTKQTFRNLENGVSKLTKTQYIAIRAVLDYEMQSGESQSNEILKKTVHYLLDNENLTQEEIDKVKNAAFYANGARQNKVDKSIIVEAFSEMLQNIATNQMVIENIGDWLAKLFIK